MSKIFSRQEMFFLQKESSYGVIPNTSGTATVAGADAALAIQIKFNRSVTDLFRKDKTGSRTRSSGTGGRRNASWSAQASLVTGGVAGTVPDLDPIFVSGFGGVATVTSGTVSVTGATNATPIVITAAAHGLSSYDVVSITGVLGNTEANGIYAVNVLTSSTFELIGSAGNAAYTSGGSVSKSGLYYKPTDAEPSFCTYSARIPYATASQRVCFGQVTKEMTFTLGQDIATFQASGGAKWVLDNLKFSSATSTEKGGLTAFPDLSLITGSSVTGGSGIAGFKGRAVINGSTMVRIRSASIKYGSALDLPQDVFGSDYVDTPEADERAVSVDFNMYEDDSAAQATLEQAAVDKTSIDMIFQLGTSPNNTVVFVLRGVQLASPERDDSQRAFTMNYSNSQAYGSSITGYNECRMWMM
jgi:hypothetical protein